MKQRREVYNDVTELTNRIKKASRGENWRLDLLRSPYSKSVPLQRYRRAEPYLPAVTAHRISELSSVWMTQWKTCHLLVMEWAYLWMTKSSHFSSTTAPVSFTRSYSTLSTISVAIFQRKTRFSTVYTTLMMKVPFKKRVAKKSTNQMWALHLVDSRWMSQLESIALDAVNDGQPNNDKSVRR